MISQLVRNSMDGKVITIPFYQPKLAKTTFLGKNLYHLIGGAGGSGKSAWIDFNYVLMPYIWYMKNKEEYDISLRIVVRSLERNKKHRIAKWVCMYLFNKYNILIDVPNLFGWGQLKSRLTEDIYEKVIEAEEYFEKMMDVVDVVDGVTNPTGLHRYAENYAVKIGDYYVKREVDGKEVVLKKLDYGKYSRLTVNEESLYGNIPHNHLYVEKNPRHITIHITDHIQAMGHEQGLGEKGNLDKHSLYSRELRDLFGFTIVNVSQLNRGIAETNRRISTDLYPEDKDFAGSSNMFNDF